jgi:PAS domain S-box-containing protein
MTGRLSTAISTSRSHRASRKWALRESDRSRTVGEFWQGTVDSLTAAIAVIDEHGTIIAVNAAWRLIAQSEGRSDHVVGSDYIAVCEASAAPSATAVANALREILAGRRDAFELEYPCHSQSTPRWFRLLASRYRGPGAPRVVLTHENITERREAQANTSMHVAIDITERKASARALLRARNYLRAVADSIGEGMYTLDPGGYLTYINQTATDLLGWSSEELVGHDMRAMTHNRSVDGSPLLVEDCPIFEARRDGKVVRVEDDIFIRRDGSQLPVSYTAAPFSTDDGVEGCVVVFEDITERKAEAQRVGHDLEKLDWLERIREALSKERLVLYAQPIVDLGTGQIVQRELLLRMYDVDAITGVIPPGSFLPVAEEFGLITEIDRWVIDQSAEIAATGEAVQVNISARSISDPSIVDYIKHALERSGANPVNVVFEITETTLISDETAARAFVAALRLLGCKIALDDFGTGYGGFTYLKQLPIDFLKIDTEFVRDLRTNPASLLLVQAIVDLAKGFGLKTVGEGVEDQETLDLLRSLGVDYAQGFHIGRPAPMAALVSG